MADDRTEIEHLRVLNAHLIETLEGIQRNANDLAQPGMVPAFSRTAISHFIQIAAEAGRALAYARLKQGAMSSE